MKNFLEPNMEVIEIKVEDVITTSPELPEVDDGAGWA